MCLGVSFCDTHSRAGSSKQRVYQRAATIPALRDNCRVRSSTLAVIMMDSTPSKINLQASSPTTAGIKRPAPSLLPAFEPLSSSPALPRPSKRQAVLSPSQRDAAYRKYPTPIPTSTTGILSSSPPQIALPRPGLQRTQSSLSERAPLSTVPTIILPATGEELLMGRSSNSSHYQLSANRLISRVHVKARYTAGTEPLEANKVEISCCGWNGVKVHCHGQTWELGKGDSFTSATESASIMLDIQDARVLIGWPSHERTASVSRHTESSWDDEESPGALVGAINAAGQSLPSSPLRIHRFVSPVSPTPAGRRASTSFQNTLPESGLKSVVQIYEDESSPEEDRELSQEVPKSQTSTEAASQLNDLGASQSSDLSEPDDDDPDEENDPIIHSFGPFGANISSRMASFTAGSSPPQFRGRVPKEFSVSPVKRSSSESTNEAETAPVINHVINQLAFSRLSSTPVSVILSNLPAALKGVSPGRSENQGLTKEDLNKLLTATPCIGEIHREGKDAAGKALESEYYYIPDEDRDAQRRAAVVDGLRKPSLRNCRKQHKVYLA